MKLVLRFLTSVTALSADLSRELQQMVVRLNTWAAVEHKADGTHSAISVTAMTFNGETQTTVGAAGAATALPANPTGYKVETINGTEYVIPYYAKS